ncbi:MAG: AraC family transcriptional regulator [Spirochaetota bacterium]
MMHADIDRRLTEEVKRMSFKLSSAGNAVLDASWNWNDYYRERTDVARIWAIRSGSISVKAATATYQLSAGRTYFIPAGMPFTASAKQVSKFWIDFNVFVFAAEEVTLFVREKRIIPVSALPRYGSAKDASVTAVDALSLWSASVNAVTSYLDRCRASIDTDRLAVFGKYRELISYIREHLSIKLSIRELSRRAGASDYYLSTQFKTDMGIRLKQYVEKLVLEKSVSLLLGSNESVRSIARALGFSNEYYFSNFFKKHARFSPMHYRERHLQERRTSA